MTDGISSAILCDPEYITEATYCLWWCANPDDVYVLKTDAVCKSSLATWDDVGRELHDVWEKMEHIRFILVCAPPGDARDEITSELTSRTPIPVLVPQKDAFYEYETIVDLLLGKGKWAVDRLLYGAEELPVQGLIDLSDVDCSKKLNPERVLSGFKILDAAIGGFYFGGLSIWTGKRGEGKSTILGQVLLEAINQGHKVCAYSGELPARQFKLGLMQQAAGYRNVVRRVDERSGRVFFDVKQEAAKLINEWWKGRMFLTDIRRENAHNERNILNLFEYAYRRYNCDTFLVDNIMTAELSDAQKVGYWQAQSSFVGRLVAFAKARDVHVHLVAHPRKTEKRIENDDVGGSGDITNRADNVFKIERVKEEERDQAGHDTLLSVMKNREFGDMPKIELDFNEASKRFYQTGTGDRRVFSWERMSRQ